jgi:hypothetical protein
MKVPLLHAFSYWIQARLTLLSKNSNLPLGPDCVKYLSKTPKAPHDIDNWMVDPLASNFTTSALAVRDLLPTEKETAQNHTIPAPFNLMIEDWTRSWWIFALSMTVFVTIILLLLCLSSMWQRRSYGNCSYVFLLEWLESYMRAKAAYYLKTLVATGATLLFVASWVVVVMQLQKLQRWSAASEFLAVCKMQKVIFYSFRCVVDLLSMLLILIRIIIFHSAMTVQNTSEKS